MPTTPTPDFKTLRKPCTQSSVIVEEVGEDFQADSSTDNEDEVIDDSDRLNPPLASETISGGENSTEENLDKSGGNEQPKVTARFVTHKDGMAVEVVGFEKSNLNEMQTKSLIQKARDKLLSSQFEYQARGETPPTEISIPIPNLEEFEVFDTGKNLYLQNKN